MTGSFRDFGAPIAVEGGLRARSARGDIGETWWSRRFLAILESFALGGRLTRGRNYARRGQVLSLEIAPGLVSAVVQGSRPTPYEIRIGLALFTDDVWAALEAGLASQALLSAGLLAGEVPPELEQACLDAGAPLFPQALADLEMHCSCPDGSVPCKHLAATFYLLAEAFDDDPFRMLEWRGRDRATLLRHLAGRAVTREEAATVSASIALSGVASPPLSEALDRFWRAPVPLSSRPMTVRSEPDLLLRQLPPPGRAIGGEELAERLRPAYEGMVAGAAED
ncbi:MAG TPA: SWIM zinc finger family protein [Micromonosporaceae bacterium]